MNRYFLLVILFVSTKSFAQLNLHQKEAIFSQYLLAQDSSEDDTMLESEDEEEEDDETQDTPVEERNTPPTDSSSQSSGVEDRAKSVPELHESDWNRNKNQNSKVPQFKKADKSAVAKPEVAKPPVVAPKMPVAKSNSGKLVGKFLISKMSCDMFADQEFKSLAKPAGKISAGKKLWTETEPSGNWVKIKRSQGEAFVKKECFK